MTVEIIRRYAEEVDGRTVEFAEYRDGEATGTTVTDGMDDAALLAVLEDRAAQVRAWEEEERAAIAEHGSAEAANKSLGLDNLAAKMQDQALTNAALRDGTPAREIYDRVMAMDPVDREAEYPPALTDDPETADEAAAT